MAAGLLLPLVASASAPEGVAEETAVLRDVLERPVVASRIRAVEARVAADSTAPAAFDNPFVEGRHEEARGPAGAATDAMTASWSVDLGFSGLPAGRAASLLRASAADRRRAAVTEVVCGVRHATLDLWAAEGRRHAVEEGHERLDRLVARLREMATAGEVAGYDVSRVQIADAVHRAERDGAVVAAEQARTQLALWTGYPVDQVALLPMVDHPALAQPVAELVAADPLLAALKAQVGAAELRLRAAKRAAVPDLVVFGGARWDAPPGTQDRSLGWEAGGAVELPLFTRNQQAIAEAEADLAEVLAQATEREALLRAEIEAATRRLQALGAPYGLPSADLWAGAVARYVSGETSIEELLGVAADVEAARIAQLEGERLRRDAQLDLACTLSSFPEAGLQSVLDEAMP